VDEGSGPTLLFLHGSPTWSFVYRDVIRSLRDEFRCIAVDYPGFGLSSAGFDESHPVWIVRRQRHARWSAPDWVMLVKIAPPPVA
jgi:pimeloyl-ACP methyl ester carboxylesterase